MKNKFALEGLVEVRWISIVMMCCFIVGCAKREDFFDRKPTVKVKGKVLSKGEPASGAILAFSRAEGVDPDFPGAQGIVNEEGDYELTTYTTKDGVIAGDYNVSLFWPTREDWWNADAEPSQLDKLKGKYAAGKSEIHRTIQEGDSEVELIEID